VGVRRGFVAIGTSVSAVILASALAAATAIGQSTPTTTTSTTTTTTPSSTTTTVPPTTTPPTTSSYPTTTSSPTTTTTAPTNPTLLLDTAIAAFQLERGAEWTLNWSLLGKSESWVAHSGQSDGTQTRTLNAGGPTGHLSLDLDGKLYVEGNAAGLANFLGFTTSASKSEAGHWVGVPKTAAVFDSWEVDLTVGTAAYMLYLGGKPVIGPTTTIRGQSVIGISQSTKADGLTISQTDYLKTSGPPLPVEIIENVDGLVITVVYGAWGKPPHAEIHKGAVPFLKTWLAKA
jgi:hypothetical protein